MIPNPSRLSRPEQTGVLAVLPSAVSVPVVVCVACAVVVAAATVSDGLQAEHFDDTTSLCDNLSAFVRERDIILVKGSRTARLENVVQRLTKDFG